MTNKGMINGGISHQGINDVLINNALNTFYIWLHGIRHMEKDHSDSESGNLMLSYGLLFPVSIKSSFICIITDGITHTMAFVTPVMGHMLQREIAQWLHNGGLIR